MSLRINVLLIHPFRWGRNLPPSWPQTSPPVAPWSHHQQRGGHLHVTLVALSCAGAPPAAQRLPDGRGKVLDGGPWPVVVGAAVVDVDGGGGGDGRRVPVRDVVHALEHVRVEVQLLLHALHHLTHGRPRGRVLLHAVPRDRRQLNELRLVEVTAQLGVDHEGHHLGVLEEGRSLGVGWKTGGERVGKGEGFAEEQLGAGGVVGDGGEGGNRGARDRVSLREHTFVGAGC